MHAAAYLSPVVIILVSLDETVCKRYTMHVTPEPANQERANNAPRMRRAVSNGDPADRPRGASNMLRSAS